MKTVFEAKKHPTARYWSYDIYVFGGLRSTQPTSLRPNAVKYCDSKHFTPI